MNGDFTKNEINMNREEEKRGFRIHRTVYLCIITLLAVVNLTLTPEFIWFIFPMLGWGTGLTLHYVNIKNQI